MQLEKSNNNAISTNPELIDFYINLGSLYEQQGKWPSAIAHYRLALRINPNLAIAYKKQADLWYKLNRFDKAAEAWYKVLELDIKLITESESITYYQKSIPLSHNSVETYRKLAQVWLQLDKKTEAIASLEKAIALELELEDSEDIYHKSEVWVNAGDNLANAERWDEAIVHYQRAIEIEPTYHQSYQNLGIAFAKIGKIELAIDAYQEILKLASNGDISFKLGMLHAQCGQFAEALTQYQQALQSQSGNPENYAKLAVILVKQGLGEQIINCYNTVFQNQPENAKHYHNLGMLLSQEGLIDDAVTCFRAAEKKPTEAEIYDTIWKSLNDLGQFNEHDPYSYYPSDLQSSEIEQYFVQTSKYTVMDIWNLSEVEKEFLENANISSTNIELIAQDKIALEEIYINNFVEDDQQRLLAKKYPKTEYSQFVNHTHLNQINAYQQSIAETGYIYSICPVSGKIIRSNQSFYDTAWLPIISYRFVGYETYYLTVGHFWGPKIFIYFPRLELIIHLSRPHPEWQAKNVINRLKSNMVSCWKETLNYISTPSKKVAAILGTIANIGHYFWNEVTGIYYLYENDILPKLDIILIEPNEYFNLGDIFPEVVDKIRRIADKRSVFKTILGENYCALRATNVVVKEKLAVRVYEGSVKRCSQSLLEEVEQARKKHFPLLWFGIRTHNKSWVSQVEGIVNIIETLATDFPNVGVLIDGWSRIETEDAYGESMIAKDQATLQKILDIIPSSIGIYSTIGSMMYEKVVWAYAIDLYVIPLGSGSTVVSWIANKPGVMHANSTINNAFREQVCNSRENYIPPVFIAVEDIVDIANPHISHANLSYDMDWKVIYNEVLKILQSIEVKK